MALARITTWVPGQVLTAAALNAEFNNILQNPVSLLSPSTANINFAGYQAIGMSLENRTATPSPNASGQIYLYTPEVFVAFHDSVRPDAVLGPNESLSRVSGLSGSLISNIGSFAAQGYHLTRPIATQRISMTINATSSFSVDTQAVGPIANGRDQAAAFASTDVHFYAISTGLYSTTIAGIASSVPPPTGPTLPGGYHFWAYLCSAKYATATSAVLQGPLTVSGSKVLYQTAQTCITFTTASGGTLTSASAGASRSVPANATQMRLLPYRYGGSFSTGVLDIQFTVASDATGAALQQWRHELHLSSDAVDFFQQGVDFDLPVINGAPEIYGDITVFSGSSPNLRVYIHGFSVANGDA